ncbi:glycoside hydrolase family 55 [Fusarium beomiforme]|uniref:Glycoside hydrolase family 55 n=1 Tax=Fusarium beomiforme TaxID=44412 RepID=A0A9P5AFG3_9HYPO|nr:glycoside hydrolase family 55 [Fusarium beomiforme]
MDHSGDFKGKAPYAGNNYDVFKTVNVGDGSAIQDAIDSGGRHNQWLASAPRVSIPGPWKVDKNGRGDPDYAWRGANDGFCRMGLSNYVNGGSNIYYYGSASWAFYDGPGYQRCTDSNRCQEYIHWIEKTPQNLQSFGWCAKDSRVALRLADGKNIMTNPDFKGSWGSTVGRYTP